jgi:hypothetical protein
MMAAQAVGEYELERIQIRAFQFFWVIWTVCCKNEMGDWDCHYRITSQKRIYFNFFGFHVLNYVCF